jgi:hypothetical protein
MSKTHTYEMHAVRVGRLSKMHAYEMHAVRAGRLSKVHAYEMYALWELPACLRCTPMRCTPCGSCTPV